MVSDHELQSIYRDVIKSRYEAAVGNIHRTKVDDVYVIGLQVLLDAISYSERSGGRTREPDLSVLHGVFLSGSGIEYLGIGASDLGFNQILGIALQEMVIEDGSIDCYFYWYIHAVDFFKKDKWSFWCPEKIDFRGKKDPTPKIKRRMELVIRKMQRNYLKKYKERFPWYRLDPFWE